MVRVFNCGIGMVVIVAEDRAEKASQMLTAAGESVFTIGRVVRRADADAPGCVVAHLDDWGLGRK